MKIWMISWMMVLLLPRPQCTDRQPLSRPADQSSVTRLVGVWRGQIDNLPGVDMVITDEGGKLRGAILFFFHFRPDVNSP